MFKQTNKIEPHDLQKIITLKEQCRIHDKNTIPIYLHLLKHDRILPSSILNFKNDELCGFLAGFFFHEEICEISVLVKPSARGKGLAMHLVSQIYPLLLRQNVQFVDFPVPQTNTIGEYLKHNHFTYRHSEYEMTRESSVEAQFSSTYNDLIIRKACKTDIPFILNLDDLCFGIKTSNAEAKIETFMNERANVITILEKNNIQVGKVHIHIYDNYARLTDICIAPSYRSKGLGKYIIANAINYVLAQNITKILLEVEATNKSALNIYTQVGFKVTNAYDFWRISVNHLGKMLSMNNS